MPDIRTAGTASPRGGDVAPDRIRRLDLARWTPAGFVLCDEFARLLFDGSGFAVTEIVPPTRGPDGVPHVSLSGGLAVLTVAAVPVVPAWGPWRDWPAARLVIFGKVEVAGRLLDREPRTLATLHRADFLAPQWRSECYEYPMPPNLSPEAEALVRQNRRLVPMLRDTLTLDATAPGWQEGDVVAVVGEE
jgi:hypothetical protein